MKFHSYIYIGIAVCFFGLLFPNISYAANAGNGTICRYVIDNDCYDEQGTYQGPAQNIQEPELTKIDKIDPDNIKITGCKDAHPSTLSVGTMNAIGGTYVPVYDAAVTLNTGYLVYKTCILDAKAAQLRQAATTDLVKKNIEWINKGDNGNSLFVTSLELDRGKITARTATEFFKNYNTDSICTPFKEKVKTAAIMAYLEEAGGESKSYSCSFGNSSTEEKELENFLKGDLKNGGGIKSLLKFAVNPSNSPIWATVAVQNELATKITQAHKDRSEKLAWGNGAAGIEKIIKIPTGTEGEYREIPITVTPGYAISKILGDSIGSSLRQAENADTWDELIDGTFLGLSTKILADKNGLLGVAEPTPPTTGSNGQTIPGQSSYLDQMLQTILNLIQKVPTDTGTSGSALPSLQAALAGEQMYLGQKQMIQAYLSQQSLKLTTEQNSCWTTVISAVTIRASGASFIAATSTIYAASSTANLITPVRLNVQQDIDAATTTIAVLQALIANVTTNNTEATNQAALQQLSALNANNTIHDAADIAAAKQSVTDIQASVGTKVDDTIASWKQGSGWCNVGNTQVVQSWFDQWKR